MLTRSWCLGTESVSAEQPKLPAGNSQGTMKYTYRNISLPGRVRTNLLSWNTLVRLSYMCLCAWKTWPLGRFVCVWVNLKSGWKNVWYLYYWLAWKLTWVCVMMNARLSVWRRTRCSSTVENDEERVNVYYLREMWHVPCLDESLGIGFFSNTV